MMPQPSESISGDEICPICGKPKSKHNVDQISKCSKQLVENGIKRHCGECGRLTKISDDCDDRCGECGQKYFRSNE